MNRCSSARIHNRLHSSPHNVYAEVRTSERRVSGSSDLPDRKVVCHCSFEEKCFTSFYSIFYVEMSHFILFSVMFAVNSSTQTQSNPPTAACTGYTPPLRPSIPPSWSRVIVSSLIFPVGRFQITHWTLSLYYFPPIFLISNYSIMSH